MLEEIITVQLVYELAQITSALLNNSQEELRKIQWSVGESNTDTEYSQLACTCCMKAWNIVQEKYVYLKDVCIRATIPDLNVYFVLGDKTVSRKIELKSSKSKTMPGSTIGKLNINQPMIYCLRPLESTIGTYIIRCDNIIKQ